MVGHHGPGAIGSEAGRPAPRHAVGPCGREEMMLFAVHISDGVLTTPWLAAGFAVAAILLALASWRVRDDEVPRIAILTAAFFVSSLIHIRLPMTSIHLLLTGLIGVVLGVRSALAIFVGLVLQV